MRGQPMTGKEVPLTASTAVRVRGARMGCAAQAVTCAEAWRERRHKPKRDAGGTANGRVSAANTQPAHRSLSMAWGGVQAGQYDQHQHRNAAPTPITTTEKDDKKARNIMVYYFANGAYNMIRAGPSNWPLYLSLNSVSTDCGNHALIVEFQFISK